VPDAYAEQAESAATLSIPDLPADDPVAAVRWAIGELRRRVNSRITASGSAVGDPRLRVGRVVSIAGVGKRFSAQSYRITSAAHTLDESGYRTRFEARLEVV
jgi:phage protein D